SNGDPLLDRNNRPIPGMGSIGIEPYPKLLYKAQKNAYGKTLVIDVYPPLYLFPDTVQYNAACAMVDDFNRRCYLTVGNEDEHRRRAAQGWGDPASEARARAEAHDGPIAEAAAEAAAAVRRMSAQAQQEYDAAGADTHQHVTDVVGTGKAAATSKARGVVADGELDGRERELRKKG